MSRTPVKSIATLKDSAVDWLELSETSVADLTPIKAMPFRYLGLNKTAVRDYPEVAEGQLLSDFLRAGVPEVGLQEPHMPLSHKDDSWSSLHFHTMIASIADLPGQNAVWSLRPLARGDDWGGCETDAGPEPLRGCRTE